MRAVSRISELFPGICLTAEGKARKYLSQGSRRVPVGTILTSLSIFLFRDGLVTAFYGNLLAGCVTISVSRRAVHDGHIWHSSSKRTMLLACNMKSLVVTFRQNIKFIGVMCGCSHYLSTNTRNYIQYFLNFV